MRAGRIRMLVGALMALALFVLDAPAAMAQLVQSDVEAEGGNSETTQLVTSSTEVRRAVIGLITLAVVVALLGILYWYKTGRLAAERHARQYGGRHVEHGSSVVGQPSAPVPAVRTDVANAYLAPVPSAAPSTPAPRGEPMPMGGYSTASAGPEPLPGAGMSTMGYAAGAVAAPHAPPQRPAPVQVSSPRPVWHEHDSTSSPQRPVPQPPQPVRVAGPDVPGPVQAPRPEAESRPQPLRPPQSPYPDATEAAAGEHGSRWSTLRRDLFG